MPEGPIGYGLFVPLHFCCRDRKVHRENFCSHASFITWTICFRGAKSLRTFTPWNFCTGGTLFRSECSKNFLFMELSLARWDIQLANNTRHIQCVRLKWTNSILAITLTNLDNFFYNFWYESSWQTVWMVWLKICKVSLQYLHHTT